MEEQSHEQIVDDLYKRLKRAIKGQKIDESTMVLIAAKAMNLAELFTEMTGPEKKLLVIDIVTKLVRKETSLSKEAKNYLLTFIELSLPSIIDSLVEAHKQKLLQKSVKNVGKSMGCFGKGKNKKQTN